jgi:biopolymer transport protein ExbD
MARRHHYRRPEKRAADLDMTTFLNLMVALIPFLLVSAVFSRITVVDLGLPSSTDRAAPSEPGFRVEVIVRDAGLELTNESAVIAKIPKEEGGYDLETLSELVLSLKRDHPDETGASVLLEPDIAYDHLIQVMDVVRSAELPPDTPGGPGTTGEPGSGGEPQRVALFPDISIGDAP